MVFLARVAALAICLLLPAFASPVSAGERTVRIAALKFGTLNWELDVIRHHAFDRKHGIDLEVVELSSKQAADVMLLGGEVDVIVTDWIWVSRQRGQGRDLTFIPYSRAVGALLVPPDSPVKSLADLAGRKIGVAGGPNDKSWIVLRALARQRHGIDLAAVAEPVFAAPPLLNEKAAQGEIDAIINFWHFLARLEAKGFRRVVSVEAAARELGLDADLPLLGYVFSQGWAEAHPGAVEGLAAASAEAKALLLSSDAEWWRLRAMMRARDDAAFAALRDGFRAGIPDPAAAGRVESAKKLFALLADLGGRDLVGDAKDLADGTFYTPP